MSPKRLAIFASGSGTNAENLCRYFADSDSIEIALIATNKADAYVLKRAESLDVPSWVFSRDQLRDSNGFLGVLKEFGIEGIVLAGFLWLIPGYLVKAFPNKIINIHPALLPSYGGKGMYGHHVHRAVVENGEKESGISIHLVNEHYDEGNILAQYKCAVGPKDDAESLAQKIHELEYAHFPIEVERWVENYLR